jgi:hypothetical protein
MNTVQGWKKEHPGTMAVERVQTGVRLEKRILKVLKALAEYLDISLGDLLEGITLHVFEGRAPFSPATLQCIAALRQVYGLTLRATDSHRLIEGGLRARTTNERAKKRPRRKARRTRGRA